MRANRFKTTVFIIGLVIALLGIDSTRSSAQTVKLFAYDTIYGAANGAVLGGATMALADDFENTAPLRFGVGLGTLYGLGVGVYDVSQVGNNQQFYIQGTFNDGTSSGVIVLLDTFYGGLTGSVVGIAITLMTNDPIVEGLRAGSGIGFWAGFGFGLFDAFALSKSGGGFSSAKPIINHTPSAQGLLAYQGSGNLSIGLISPSIYQTKNLRSNNLSQSAHVGLNVLNLNVNL